MEDVELAYRLRQRGETFHDSYQLGGQVAGKTRVHEFAKELNITSKDVLRLLAELGEYVKSAARPRQRHAA